MDEFLLPLPSFKMHSCLQLLSLFQSSFWIIKKFYWLSRVNISPAQCALGTWLLLPSCHGLLGLIALCDFWSSNQSPCSLFFQVPFQQHTACLALDCVFSPFIWPVASCWEEEMECSSCSVTLVSVSFLGDGSYSQGAWWLVPHNTRTPLGLGCTHRCVAPQNSKKWGCYCG